MKWLADNYKWLFDGIGALVIIGVVGYLLRRFMRAAEPAPIWSNLNAKKRQMAVRPT